MPRTTPRQSARADGRGAPNVGAMGVALDDGATPGLAVAHRAGVRRRSSQPGRRRPGQASSNRVCKWRGRFRVLRLPGLTEPRPGAPPRATNDGNVDVITRTLEGPPAHATQWTTRSMADVAGLFKATTRASGRRLAPVASPRHVQSVGRASTCGGETGHRRVVSLSAEACARLVDG